MGTARMGTDPERSVVDAFGRVTTFLISSSWMPSIFVTASAVNPTATAQALALRAADHIVATRLA